MRARASDPLSSSDEDEDLGGAGGRRRSRVASGANDAGNAAFAPPLRPLTGRSFLEEVPATPPDSPAASPAAPTDAIALPPAASGDDDDGDDGAVFEIRDFTTASSFERITHQITLAAKKWAGLLRRETIDEDGLMSRDEFNHMEFKYELTFQLVRPEASDPTPGASPSVGVDKARSTTDRLGLHTFPMRAHRLQRWFGVHHFLIVSVRGQNIDVDSARTVLSAAALAVQNVAPAFDPPISCFVPVDGGKRRRYLGELMCGGARAVYSVDQRGKVDASLEHLEGLQDFFCRKFAVGATEVSRNLMCGARFTYLADAFDPFEGLDAVDNGTCGDGASCSGRGSSDSEGSTAASPSASSGGAEREARVAAAHSEALLADDEQADPIESMQLHCLWPSFPRDSFVDNATYSELDPRIAPFWKLRLTKSDQAPLPLSKSLRTLLDFRKEARTVRSATAALTANAPKTAMASLSMAIQESLESILLPSDAEMQDLVAQCLTCPISTPSSSSTSPAFAAAAGTAPFSAGAAADLLPRLARLRGARLTTLMAKLAELGSQMRCFKGVVMLWCRVLAQMRHRWDSEQPLAPDAEPPPTGSVSARAVRAEHFGSSCLAQQKFEMLLRSAQVRSASSAGLRMGTHAGATAEEVEGLLLASGAQLLVPELLHPALLTEDMVLQLDMAAASIAEPAERAELCGRELRSDVAAFKAANVGASLEDFLTWRTRLLGLSVEPFPREWLEEMWEAVPAKSAAEQSSRLFEPEREAEMALHYLENIEGTHLLLQVFRSRLSAALEQLSASAAAAAGAGAAEAAPAYLRVLRERAISACLTAFTGGYRAGIQCDAAGSGGSPGADDTNGGGDFCDGANVVMGEVDDFPSEDALQAALQAVEAFEASTRLALSLRAKFPGPGASLVEELLSEGEAAVTSDGQRRIIEDIFHRSRVLAQTQGREAPDGRGVFESLPLAKEFVLSHQPPASADTAATKRMYAEIRERQMRIAIARGFRLT